VKRESGARPCDFIAAQSVKASRDSFIVSRDFELSPRGPIAQNVKYKR